MRRSKSEMLIATLFLVLLGSYVWYTQRVIVDLRGGRAAVDGDVRARVSGVRRQRAGLDGRGARRPRTEHSGAGRAADPHRPERGHHRHTRTSRSIPGTRSPTPIRGSSSTSPCSRASIRRSSIRSLEKSTTAIPPVVRWLRIIPALQASMAAILLLAWRLHRADARRRGARAPLGRHGARVRAPTGHAALEPRRLDRAAWKNARATNRRAAAAQHMRADLDRLDRVAHRFERIGRDPKFDDVDVGALVARVARYFQARVPTLANTIVVEHDEEPGLPKVEGRRGAARVGHRGPGEERDRRARRPGRTRAAHRGAQRVGGRRHSRRRRRPGRVRANFAPACSSRDSRRSRAAGASASRSPSASSKRITAACCSSRLPMPAPPACEPLRARPAPEPGRRSRLFFTDADAAGRTPDVGSQPGAARSCAPRRRSLARARRCGLGQDARAHDAHRAADRRRGRERATHSRRHVHEQSRRRDARSHRPAVSGSGPAGMWAGTFHAIGARMLRASAHLVDRTPTFTIYDQDDTLGVVKRLMERHGVSPKQFAPRARAVGDLRREERARRAGGVRAPGASIRFRRRSRRCIKGSADALRLANAVDFDDLLVLPVRMLQRTRRAARALSRSIQVHPRRRVSGHESRAVRADQAPRRRARQRVRRRRRRPIDLRLARRRHPQHPRLQQGLSPARPSCASRRTIARRRRSSTSPTS